MPPFFSLLEWYLLKFIEVILFLCKHHTLDNFSFHESQDLGNPYMMSSVWIYHNYILNFKLDVIVHGMTSRDP